MKKILCLLLILMLCGCGNESIKNNEVSVMDINTETVYSEVDNKDVYIIDVREDYEYESGHIRNSYNIPMSGLTEISEVVSSLDSKIIVYCQSGNRSGMAAKKLIEMGYTNVYDMGGINSWNYELIK